MDTVKLSSKGQIVIPKNIREAHKLTTGTEFIISFVGDEIRLVPAPHFPRTEVERGLGILHRRGRKRLTEEETRAKILDLVSTKDKATRK
ncbi:MAG TPA: AbrB/MazE/SpoVT family DNA-binding domain-containing protein [Burkholderiales bacterium]|nr:AbrB/MazE/SpoVT family DNA-binding domain-containing protein [Burkholderiales bacterium]